LNDHKNHIEKLKIVYLDGNFVRTFFPLFVDLKELRLLKIYKNSTINSDVMISLPNLKFLEIDANHEILNKVKASNLEEIEVHGYKSYNESFMDRSPKLKKLTFSGQCLPELKNFVPVRLKLKKLKFNIFGDHNSNYRNNNIFRIRTQNFLLSQKENLEEISLNFYSGGNNELISIIEFCLSKMKFLTKFFIKINYRELSFRRKNDKTSINDSIKNLEFHGNIDSINLTSLISCCPSATSVTINNDRHTMIDIPNFISIYMQNIKYLTITSFFNEISPKTICENVEKLKIVKLFSRSEEVWHKIAVTCPNIKELTLNDEIVEISPQNLANVLKNCQKIEILSFSADKKFHIFKGFFEVFVDYPGNIQTVNFTAAHIEEWFYRRVAMLKKKQMFKLAVEKFKIQFLTLRRMNGENYLVNK